MKHKVFISYSRHDYVNASGEVILGNYISAIMDALEKNHISYWIDKEGVFSGDEFKGVLTEAIEHAAVFIFVSSAYSNQSEWTAKEINVAVYEKKKIIPVLIDDSKYNSSVKLDLVGLDFINLKINPELGLKELIKSIKKCLGTSDVDIQKIKDEIKALEREGANLYTQEKRLFDEIAAKKRLIGEGTKICPVCSEEAEINSLSCPRCGWAYVPFTSKKLDEKRLDTSRRVWNRGISSQQETVEVVSKKFPQPIIKLIDNMVRVEGGSFMMGGTPEQGEEAFSDEKPPHKVTVSTFYIGRYPVTQDQWKAVMGSNPSYFQGERHPVEQVNWTDCQDFVKKLSKITGKKFRLPTEAEWEFAARGGVKRNGYKYSGGNQLSLLAWYNENSGSTSHEVGQKTPNELGLYDMSGNIWEWVQDWKGDFTDEEQTNPTGPETGDEKVCRGGGWNREHDRCRVSYRGDDEPDLRYRSLGLRVVLDK